LGFVAEEASRRRHLQLVSAQKRREVTSDSAYHIRRVVQHFGRAL
jgi:hypothetical protein